MSVCSLVRNGLKLLEKFFFYLFVSWTPRYVMLLSAHVNGYCSCSQCLVMASSLRTRICNLVVFTL